MDDARRAVERAFRAESGRAIATLTRLFGDLSTAEDAVQEAFVDALRTWPERGTPDRPGGWITTTARNRALDRMRREARRPAKERAAGRLVPLDDDAASPGIGPGRGEQRLGDEAEIVPVDDDRLRLMFTCCHPALAPAAQIALTLRLVCGLHTSESPGRSSSPRPPSTSD